MCAGKAALDCRVVIQPAHAGINQPDHVLGTGGFGLALVLRAVQLPDQLGAGRSGEHAVPSFGATLRVPLAMPHAVHEPETGSTETTTMEPGGADCGWRRKAGRSTRRPAPPGAGCAGDQRDVLAWRRQSRCRTVQGSAARSWGSTASPSPRASRPCGPRTAARSRRRSSPCPCAAGFAAPNRERCLMKVLSLFRPATPFGASRS